MKILAKKIKENYTFIALIAGIISFIVPFIYLPFSDIPRWYYIISEIFISSICIVMIISIRHYDLYLLPKYYRPFNKLDAQGINDASIFKLAFWIFLVLYNPFYNIEEIWATRNVACFVLFIKSYIKEKEIRSSALFYAASKIKLTNYVSKRSQILDISNNSEKEREKYLSNSEERIFLAKILCEYYTMIIFITKDFSEENNIARFNRLLWNCLFVDGCNIRYDLIEQDYGLLTLQNCYQDKIHFIKGLGGLKDFKYLDPYIKVSDLGFFIDGVEKSIKLHQKINNEDPYDNNVLSNVVLNLAYRRYHQVGVIYVRSYNTELFTTIENINSAMRLVYLTQVFKYDNIMNHYS